MYSCPKAISLVGFRMIMFILFHMAIPLAVKKGSLYRCVTKLSLTTLLYLYYRPQAINLVGFRMVMFTPFHLAITLAVQ